MLLLGVKEGSCGLSRTARDGGLSGCRRPMTLARRVCAVVIALSVLATGCGSASHHPSGKTTVPPAAPSSVDRTTSTGRASRVHPLTHARHVANRRAATRFVRATGKRRVLLAASSACAFARIGAPAAPPQSAGTDSWRRYAAAARSFALGTAASLEKVPSGRLRVSGLQRLSADYLRLARVYARGGSIASVARTIVASEERTAVDALAARLPACAPAPPTAAQRS